MAKKKLTTEHSSEQCEVTCIHEDRVSRVKQNSLKAEEVLGLEDIFKALGDSTRIKLLHALSQEEMCVCDLAEVIGMSQSLVSHQLRVLRNLRLVKHRREGKMVYYSLDDEHILQLFTQGLEHIRHR
ncbi:MAG TPA: metalloregulator ArsR/SmtB family transcription factor [Peptococcaceae bacterium]|nr:metalloregulator ArsR/SmtB family transcription factor [Peptococcaceae bacterium]HPZ71175.1 metalloregulator ArsR/SmtB family transcription factor [Peptococcaceae bacterium]HQD54479.1 metalloregulator ArsR/SmtB family transcription factor [Peptococcaceae bacterium]